MSFQLPINETGLVIPDLHLRHETAEKLIGAIKPAWVLFLGDYFDDFYDTPAKNQAAAEWLAHSIQLPGRYHLWGNHDLHYAFPWREIRGSGHSPAKQEVIQKVMRPHWGKLDFFATWQPQKSRPWLLSHSGLHLDLTPAKLKHDWPRQLKWLTAEEAHANHDLRNVGPTWMAMPGWARSVTTNQRFGGLVWGDWADFDGPSGINQLVGHTPQSAVEQLDRGNRKLICLDTWSHHPDGSEPSVAIFSKNGHILLPKVSELL